MIKKNRSWQQAAAVMTVAALLTAAGCSMDSSSPKLQLEAALADLATETSYSFQSNIDLRDLNVPGAQGAEAGQVAELLKSMKISMDGSYRQDLMRTDANVKLVLPGTSEAALTLPIIRTADKVYIKIPLLPGLPGDGWAGG